MIFGVFGPENGQANTNPEKIFVKPTLPQDFRRKVWRGLESGKKNPGSDSTPCMEGAKNRRRNRSNSATASFVKSLLEKYNMRRRREIILYIFVRYLSESYSWITFSPQEVFDY